MRAWLVGLAVAGLAVAWGSVHADEVEGTAGELGDVVARPSSVLTRHIVNSSNAGLDQRLSPLGPSEYLGASLGGVTKPFALQHSGPILPDVSTTDEDCTKASVDCTKVADNCTATLDCTNATWCTNYQYCTTGECTKATGCTGGSYCTASSGCTQGTNCTTGDYCTKDTGSCTGGSGPAGGGCTSGGGCTASSSCTTGKNCTGDTQCTSGQECTKSNMCTKNAGSHCTKSSGAGENCTKGGGCTDDDDCVTKATNCTQATHNGCYTDDVSKNTCDTGNNTCDPSKNTCDVTKATCNPTCTTHECESPGPGAYLPSSPLGPLFSWSVEGPVLASLDNPGVPRVDATPHGAPRSHPGFALLALVAFLIPAGLSISSGGREVRNPGARPEEE